MMAKEWFYSHDGKRHGPVSSKQLRNAARTGKLSPDDLVWHDGMHDWRKASTIRGLFDTSYSYSEIDSSLDNGQSDSVIDGETVAPFGQNTEEINSYINNGDSELNYPFEYMLSTGRNCLPISKLYSSYAFGIKLGQYSIHIAVVVIWMYAGFLSVKSDSLNPVYAGVATGLCLLVLQYISVRLCGALNAIVESTPTRISSTAFIDSVAAVTILITIALPAFLVIVAVQEDSLQIALAAICTFSFFAYLSAVALNPAFLNVIISKDASAGEEAIAIFSFLIMLRLRMIPFLFGIGAVAATSELVLSLIIWLEGEEKSYEILGEFGLKEKAIIGLLASAAVPLVSYFTFLFNYLVIDIVRAILSLPSKIDVIGSETENEEPKEHLAD